jgi:hypothetical protein
MAVGGYRPPQRKTKAQIEAEERARLAAAKPAPKTVLDVIQGANTFKPGIPQSLRKPGLPDPNRNLPTGLDTQSGPYSWPTTTNNNAARDQAARDQAAREQAARDQAAREQAAREAAAAAAAREAARREQERLEALKRAEEARIAAIVAARPTVPRYLASTSVEPVKYASPADVLIQESTLPVDLILKQTLEKIGGLELISIVRHDTVNGQDIAYQPVKNLSQIQLLYNPQNLVKIPDSSELFFKNFAIKIEAHIPPPDDGQTVSIDMFSKKNNVYLNPTNGKIVLELANLKPDYEVEIQTVSLGKVFDDTIYDEDK